LAVEASMPRPGSCLAPECHGWHLHNRTSEAILTASGKFGQPCTFGAKGGGGVSKKQVQPAPFPATYA
jgi:hypothetical protein